MSSKIVFRNSQSGLADLRQEPFEPASFRRVLEKARSNEWVEDVFKGQSDQWEIKLHHSEALKRVFLLVTKAPSPSDAEKWDLRRFFIAFMDRYHKELQGTQIEVMWRLESREKKPMNRNVGLKSAVLGQETTSATGASQAAPDASQGDDNMEVDIDSTKKNHDREDAPEAEITQQQPIASAGSSQIDIAEDSQEFLAEKDRMETDKKPLELPELPATAASAAHAPKVVEITDSNSEEPESSTNEQLMTRRRSLGRRRSTFTQLAPSVSSQPAAHSPPPSRSSSKVHDDVVDDDPVPVFGQSSSPKKRTIARRSSSDASTMTSVTPPRGNNSKVEDQPVNKLGDCTTLVGKDWERYSPLSKEQLNQRHRAVREYWAPKLESFKFSTYRGDLDQFISTMRWHNFDWFWVFHCKGQPVWYEAFVARFKKEFRELHPLPADVALNTFTLSLSGNFDYYWKNREVDTSIPSAPLKMSPPSTTGGAKKRKTTSPDDIEHDKEDDESEAAFESTEEEAQFNKQLDSLRSDVELYVRRLLRGIDLSKKDKPFNSRLANDLLAKYPAWLSTMTTSGGKFVKDMKEALRDDSYVQSRKVSPDALIQNETGKFTNPNATTEAATDG